MLQFIHIPAFLISFAIGIFVVYITMSPTRKIIVYPTPDNIDRVMYKDKSDACFTYSQEKVSCAANKDKLYVIPEQN